MPRVYVFAAHLTRAPDVHGGSFSEFKNDTSAHSSSGALSRMATLWAQTLRDRRPVIGTVALHIVHDSPDRTLVAPSPFVHIHQADAHDAMRDVPTIAGQAPHDRRTALFLRLIRSLALPPNACVFTVDLTDVGIIGQRKLVSLCQQHPDAIFAGADSSHHRPLAAAVRARRRRPANGPAAALANADFDGCSAFGPKGWWYTNGLRANWTYSRELSRFLRSRAWTDTPLYNCGIAGGRLAVFEPFLRRMADLLARHHVDNPSGKYRPVDMLAFNELILTRGRGHDNRTSSAGVVTGFPLGPVNLPMSSTMCGRVPMRYDAHCASVLYNQTRTTPREQLAACTRRLLTAMAPDYFFVHKVHFMQHTRAGPMMRARVRRADGTRA